MLRTLTILAMLALLGATLAGCNTFEGMGADIEAIGAGLQDLAS